MTVRARRQLTTPEAADAFLSTLSAKLEENANANAYTMFDDFDISQNPLSVDNFKALFGIFVESGVAIQRIRLFGCSTLDDTVAWQMAAWLSSLTRETVLHELHLSDCALTSEGLLALCDAFAGNDAFPPRNIATGAICPMYIRIENNYIDQSVIQQKIDEGVLTYFMKNAGSLPNPNAKVKVLVQTPGRFSQRVGQPPPPELAPPPKPVNDRNSIFQFQNAANVNQVFPHMQQQPGSPQVQIMQQTLMHQNFMQQNLSPQVFALQQQIAEKVMQQVGQMGSAVQRGSADRSRSPVPRAASKAASARRPKPPAQRAPVQLALPYPWEEHWSDEYGIPYFWNSKTGDSAWERPAALTAAVS